MSALIRWNPVYRVRPYRRVFNQMGRLAPSWDTRVVMPLDIEEDEEGYLVTASVPGFAPDDLTIEVEDDVLTIRAEQKGDEEQEHGDWHLRERYMGAIERRLRLGKNVNAEAIEAELEHGVLKLALPKAEEVKPKLIKVNVAE
jgi:HSP20 family protein